MLISVSETISGEGWSGDHNLRQSGIYRVGDSDGSICPWPGAGALPLPRLRNTLGERAVMISQTEGRG